jgi:hypothetical protein
MIIKLLYRDDLIQTVECIIHLKNKLGLILSQACVTQSKCDSPLIWSDALSYFYLAEFH